MEKGRYVGNCVELHGDIISEMKDVSEEIDYKDFIDRIIDPELLKTLFPVYDWDEEGLQIWDDFMVSFYKSVFDEMDCLFISHSSIEYVWVIPCVCDDGLAEEICQWCNGSGKGTTDKHMCESCNGVGFQIVTCDCPKGKKHK